MMRSAANQAFGAFLGRVQRSVERELRPFEQQAISAPVISVYVFRPHGHGGPTLMVAAESEGAARAAVQGYVTTRQLPSDYEDSTQTLEVYAIGQVAENDND